MMPLQLRLTGVTEGSLLTDPLFQTSVTEKNLKTVIQRDTNIPRHISVSHIHLYGPEKAPDLLEDSKQHNCSQTG